MSNPKGYRESCRFIARKRGFHAYFRRPRHAVQDQNARTVDLLKNHRWFIHAGYRRACHRASSRKLGERSSPLQEREEGKGGANVPTNGIDPSLVVNAVAMAIDTRCQERTNRSELQPRLRTTRRARIRPQSFREITGNAIAAITLGDAFN